MSLTYISAHGALHVGLSDSRFTDFVEDLKFSGTLEISHNRSHSCFQSGGEETRLSLEYPYKLLANPIFFW